MKSDLPVHLSAEILAQAGVWCSTSTSADPQPLPHQGSYRSLDQDMAVVRARVEREGDEFLTITLPAFGKEFERALDLGRITPDQFRGWKLAKHGRTPLFLGWFMELVFDRSTGVLLETPSVEAIRTIRQFTLMWGKINRACTQAREKAAIDGFIKCEQSVRDFDQLRSLRLSEEFAQVANLLWSRVFTRLDKVLYEDGVLPKHGPGSTAERVSGNGKYAQVEWTDRLEEWFPSAEYLLPNWRFLPDIGHLTWLEPGAERPVRVVTVPKTQKTPRVIALEPVCMQYVQQGILELLVPAIENDSLMGGFVGFTDQIPNREMARKGSLDGSLATLDLSEASDRVSNELVHTLFQNFGTMRGMIEACRSTRADVPGYGVIPLSKFASMGSALCFPVEALVFTTLVFLGIQKVLRRQLTTKDIHSFRGKVRVYGDDIIVPVEYVLSVIETLEAYGLVVNKSKSFWTGKFRESCGGDYYAGEDVTPIRVRQDVPTSLKDAQGLQSWAEFRNHLYRAGHWKTVRVVDESIMEPVLRGRYPYVLDGSDSGLISRYSFLGLCEQDEWKMCPRLHKPLVKGLKVEYVIPRDNLEDYGALMKFFLKRGEEPTFDAKHLERSGRPRTARTKFRWASAV